MAVAVKDSRVDFRVSDVQKSLLEKAAEIKHISCHRQLNRQNWI